MLFRQATLAWLAEYCERTGRTLHLYGRGWEAHPRFARYARGVARNGHELRAIYQASRINLQIMPFGCIHPRLLDGLAAGGFFLLRYCAQDVLHGPAQRVLEAVERLGLAPGAPVPAGEAPALAQALRELSALRGEPPPGDTLMLTAVQLDDLRDQADLAFRRCAGQLFDDYGQVAFASADELVCKAERFLSDARARAETAERMRNAVIERFSYDALVRDLLAFLRTSLPAG